MALGSVADYLNRVLASVSMANRAVAERDTTIAMQRDVIDRCALEMRTKNETIAMLESTISALELQNELMTQQMFDKMAEQAAREAKAGASESLLV